MQRKMKPKERLTWAAIAFMFLGIALPAATTLLGIWGEEFNPQAEIAYAFCWTITIVVFFTGLYALINTCSKHSKG